MHNRLLSFINKHNLLYKHPFGFRKGHITNMAQMLLEDRITSALDKGHSVSGIVLEFSKALTPLISKYYWINVRSTASEALPTHGFKTIFMLELKLPIAIIHTICIDNLIGCTPRLYPEPLPFLLYIKTWPLSITYIISRTICE